MKVSWSNSWLLHLTFFNLRSSILFLLFILTDMIFQLICFWNHFTKNNYSLFDDQSDIYIHIRILIYIVEIFGYSEWATFWGKSIRFSYTHPYHRWFEKQLFLACVRGNCCNHLGDHFIFPASHVRWIQQNILQ